MKPFVYATFIGAFYFASLQRVNNEKEMVREITLEQHYISLYSTFREFLKTKGDTSPQRYAPPSRLEHVCDLSTHVKGWIDDLIEGSSRDLLKP